MSHPWQTVSGVVKSGYKVASGMTDNSPYPKGTIKMQTPIFKSLGFDLTPFFPGTLNISISPKKFIMKAPKYTFRNVHWAEGFAAEDFSFSSCCILFSGIRYEGFVYYPHPETKIGHFQDPSIIEVIAPSIPNLQYGDRLNLEINPIEISLTEQSVTG